MNWVFIRGLARQQDHWFKFPELFKQQIGGDIYFYDLKGVGNQAHEKAPFSIGEYVEDLHQRFIKDKSNGKEWSLLAVSLGGMIGLEWINRYPEDFKHLVTINTSAGNLNPPTERLQMGAIEKIIKLFFSNDVGLREKTILELTTNQFEVTNDIVKKWVTINDKNPLKRMTFVAQIFAASRFKVPSKLPFSPLVLASKADRLTNCKCSEKLSSHFQTPHAFHDKAGHDLMLDDSQWVIDQIKKHIG